MGEAIHDCRYCDERFEGERRYLRHLEQAHDRAELGRIDRHRVESVFGDGPRSELDRLAVLLSQLVPVRTIDWLGSLATPVPRRTVVDLALLGVALTVGLALVLAMLGP